MNRACLAIAFVLAAGASARAEEAVPMPTSAEIGAATPPAPAVGLDLFASSDADHTEVSKLALSFDWRRSGPEEYEGIRLETARFRPLGQAATKDVRAYYRFADQGHRWTWSGQVGTDGDTVLGAVNVHNMAKFRQEYFLEREIVETPQSLARGVYYTFAGAAVDLPIDPRNNLTVVGAVQNFTGRNLRLHLRTNYLRVLQADWGLTAQIRSRYFHSTHPGEFDYFSPRNFVQVVPTLQVRRYRGGWRYALAAGLGAQRQTGGGWRQARAFSAQVTSPPVNEAWSLDAVFQYSNTPTGGGTAYDYRQLSLGLRRAF